MVAGLPSSCQAARQSITDEAVDQLSHLTVILESFFEAGTVKFLLYSGLYTVDGISLSG